MKNPCLKMLLLMVALTVGAAANAQQTVGLFQNDVEAYDGYTMFSKGGTTYLIDNAGLVVHTWNKGNNNTNPGYLMDDGNLVAFTGTGFEVLDWDSNVVWAYTDAAIHHDIQPLPNGNVIVILRDSYTNAEAIAAGRDPATLAGTVGPLAVHEIADPGVIVWEWHLWDHLIQDYDNTKANYGVVADYPELVDFNVYHNTSNDWIHANGIAYNADLDQIIVSARHFNEAWVIDHSTNTSEAAGHTGGNAGMGGDLLYRWGHPLAYGAGTAGDQMLFGQHDTQWIEPGLPGAGNILIFDNGTPNFGGPGYSTIVEIVPPLSGYNYTLTPGTAYAPTSPTWIYQATPPGDFFSTFISGAQRLPNGNTLIDQGADGTLFEVTSAGQMVWKYVNPATNTAILDWNDVPANQGPGKTNSIFNVARYGKGHVAFAGKDLTPSGEIEGWTTYVDLTLQSTIGGSVVSRPEGTYAYGVGQLATLVAEPEGGFVFNGWTVEAGTLVVPAAADLHTTVTIDGSDATVQANFIEEEVFNVPVLPAWGIPLLGLLFAASGALVLERRRSRV